MRPLPARVHLATTTDLVMCELERADAMERAARPDAAAEHAHLALRLSVSREPAAPQIAALRILCRAAADHLNTEEAVAYGRRAAALALQLERFGDWAGAMRDCADAALGDGAPEAVDDAEALLREIVARGDAWDRPDVEGAGAEALAAAAEVRGDPEAVVMHAWRALELLAHRRVGQGTCRRGTLQGLLAAGLAHLGLEDAAERALDPAPDAGTAVLFLLEAGRVLAAAEAGEPEIVLERARRFEPADVVLRHAAGAGGEHTEAAVRAGVWLSRALRLARQPERSEAQAEAALALATAAGDRGLMRLARAALDAAALAEPVALAIPLSSAVPSAVRAIAGCVLRSGPLPHPSPS